MPIIKNHQGFTLIELVVVIIILGILAVAVAPKFLGFSTDARISVLESIRGDMQSASSLVYAKGVIDNVPDTGTDSERVIQTNFGPVDSWYKYPESIGEQGTGFGIVELISLNSENIEVYDEITDDPSCYAIKVGYDESTCFVQYKEACSTTIPPEISLETTGC